jgi:hypothetical protein
MQYILTFSFLFKKLLSKKNTLLPILISDTVFLNLLYFHFFSVVNMYMLIASILVINISLVYLLSGYIKEHKKITMSITHKYAMFCIVLYNSIILYIM